MREHLRRVKTFTLDELLDVNVLAVVSTAVTSPNSLASNV
jgi:hypothetical protein